MVLIFIFPSSLFSQSPSPLSFLTLTLRVPLYLPCCHQGAFHVTNHGVPPSLFVSLHHADLSFFNDTLINPNIFLTTDTFFFHFWNAWEEHNTEEVVVNGSCMTPLDSIFKDTKESLKSVLMEIRLNLRSGKSMRRVVVEEMKLEAEMVN